MSNRRAHRSELLFHTAGWLVPPGGIQRLAYPFGSGHVARTRDPLDLAIIGIMQNDL